MKQVDRVISIAELRTRTAKTLEAKFDVWEVLFKSEDFKLVRNANYHQDNLQEISEKLATAMHETVIGESFDHFDAFAASTRKIRFQMSNWFKDA